jgi:aryl-alcohol dehydrogenase-like predicted oxidoreductase
MALLFGVPWHQACSLENIAKEFPLTAALEGYDWLHDELTDKEKLDKVQSLEPIASELGCSLSQLALAWCLKNPFVSTVITGASRVEQLHENMKATEVAPKLTPEILERIDEIIGIKQEEDED